MSGPVAAGAAWPALPVPDWQDTRDTLHLWTQVVGKTRLALAPMTNHWWQVPLYLSAHGLTTSLMPYRHRGLEVTFDFQQHLLHLHTTDGQHRTVALAPRTVADFYQEFMARLAELDIQLQIYPRPVEVPVAVPFAEDDQHASYDPEHAHAFWRSLVQAHRVFDKFRARFTGKVSPVHFFWGSFDLALSRFSGRPAPPHPGTVPNCPDWVNQEAYSHEVSSCGYWPGGDEEGFFYAYAYPEPPGYPDWPVRPEGAGYHREFGEFLLPYAQVRRSGDPDATLLSFLQSSYEAAAELAGWRRDALERVPG